MFGNWLGGRPSAAVLHESARKRADSARFRAIRRTSAKNIFPRTPPNVRRTFGGLHRTPRGNGRIRVESAANLQKSSLKNVCRAQHECTSSSVLGGKRSQLCLCCRPTHSPSGSPIRTTSSIKCGAGTDWPGEWHSPVILKLTIGGVRRCSLTTGSWSQHPQPHRSGSTVSGGSPRYRTVSLFPFLRTCIAAGEPANSSVSSHSLNHLSSWVLAARSKPLKKVKTVLPFRPKGMAKSQNGQAHIVA